MKYLALINCALIYFPDFMTNSSPLPFCNQLYSSFLVNAVNLKKSISEKEEINDIINKIEFIKSIYQKKDY